MFRPVVCTSLALVSLLQAGCKTAEEAGSEAKDTVTPSGPVTRYYYAVRDEARRTICPFGIETEDTAAFRAQCEPVTRLPLEALAERLVNAYSERFKDGDDLEAKETQALDRMLRSLAGPTTVKADAGLEGILARFTQVLDEAFGKGSDGVGDPGGSAGADGDDSGTQILTASFVAPRGVSVTPLVVAQTPVATSAVTAQLNGCIGRILAVGIAEEAGRPTLTLDGTAPGKFIVPDGTPRRATLIQLTINGAGGFCQVKVTSAGVAKGPTPPVHPGQLGPETLAGAVHYNGGFVPQLVTPLDPPRHVKQFRVEVPPSCKADIVKGGILTTQQVAPTTRIDARAQVFRVNDGAGALASGVSVSLNGPLGFCEIQVFVR